MDRFSEELYGTGRYETFHAADEPTCTHENMRRKEWDYGTCSDTGYHDSGVLYTCRDCDESWYEDELPMLTLQSAECVECGSNRKTVQSDRISVNPAAVCCDQKEIA